MWKWLVSAWQKMRGKKRRLSLPAATGIFAFTGGDSVPRKLRISFPVAATLGANKGTYSVTSQTATLTYVQNSGVTFAVADKWTQVDPGGNPPTNGPWGAFHFDSDISSQTGKILLSWGTAAQQRGTFTFDTRGTHTWSYTSTIDDPAHTLNVRENYAMAYDKDNNLFWISPGAPNGWGNLDGDPDNGTVYFDPTTNLFAVKWQMPDGFGNADGWAGYYAGNMYALGSSYNPTSVLRQRNISTSTITNLDTAGTPPRTEPDYTSSEALLYQRMGIDSRTGQIWCFADSFELWIYDINGAQRWVKIPTFGTKPHPYSIVEFHEAGNSWVAWVCNAGNNGAQAQTTDVLETRVLDASTLTWRAGPIAANGDAVPTGVQKTVNLQRLMYDTAQQSMYLLQASDLGVNVWKFDLAGPQL